VIKGTRVGADVIIGYAQPAMRHTTSGIASCRSWHGRRSTTHWAPTNSEMNPFQTPDFRRGDPGGRPDRRRLSSRRNQVSLRNLVSCLRMRRLAASRALLFSGAPV